MQASKGRRAQQGFTLIHVLLLTALLTGAVAAVAPSYAFQVQREREQALLDAGTRVQLALQAYYQAAPGNLKRWPKELSELTRDPRYVGVKRHLRRVEGDPMRPGQPLELIRNADGDIVGVFSPVTKRPLSDAAGRFPGAASYADWKFIAKE